MRPSVSMTMVGWSQLMINLSSLTLGLLQNMPNPNVVHPLKIFTYSPSSIVFIGNRACDASATTVQRYQIFIGD